MAASWFSLPLPPSLDSQEKSASSADYRGWDGPAEQSEMQTLPPARCRGLCTLPCSGHLFLSAMMGAFLSFSHSVLLKASETERQVFDCFGHNAYSLLQP